MTYSDPHSPYEPPPRDSSTAMWMAGAIIVLLVLAGVVYAFTNRNEQTASNDTGPAVTTGQSSGDSRMAPPPPAPVK